MKVSMALWTMCGKASPCQGVCTPTDACGVGMPALWLFPVCCHASDMPAGQGLVQCRHAWFAGFVFFGTLKPFVGTHKPVMGRAGGCAAWCGLMIQM